MCVVRPVSRTACYTLHCFVPMLAGGLNATAKTPVDHRSDANRSDERRSAVRSRLGSNTMGQGQGQARGRCGPGTACGSRCAAAQCRRTGIWCHCGCLRAQGAWAAGRLGPRWDGRVLLLMHCCVGHGRFQMVLLEQLCCDACIKRITSTAQQPHCTQTYKKPECLTQWMGSTVSDTIA